jgi:hypothetical protein
LLLLNAVAICARGGGLGRAAGPLRVNENQESAHKLTYPRTTNRPLARALADGRLTSSRLGVSLAEGWTTPLVTPADSLSLLPPPPRLNRGHVRHAITLALRTTPHTDAAQILELLHELCHADGVGIDDGAARSSLASYTSGKAGRLAKSLLAI